MTRKRFTADYARGARRPTDWRDAADRETTARWRIMLRGSDDEPDTPPMYWDRQGFWDYAEHARVYTTAEKAQIVLPPEGEWHRIEEAR